MHFICLLTIIICVLVYVCARVCDCMCGGRGGGLLANIEKSQTRKMSAKQYQWQNRWVEINVCRPACWGKFTSLANQYTCHVKSDSRPWILYLCPFDSTRLEEVSSNPTRQCTVVKFRTVTSKHASPLPSDIACCLWHSEIDCNYKQLFAHDQDVITFRHFKDYWLLLLSFTSNINLILV